MHLLLQQTVSVHLEGLNIFADPAIISDWLSFLVPKKLSRSSSQVPIETPSSKASDPVINSIQEGMGIIAKVNIFCQQTNQSSGKLFEKYLLTL
jgi:hypothetical protein